MKGNLGARGELCDFQNPLGVVAGREQPLAGYEQKQLFN